MENFKLISPTEMHYVKIDRRFNQILEEFLYKYDTSTNKYKRDVRRNITLLYKHCLEDKKVISNRDSSLIINHITLEHVLDFQKKIENQVYTNVLSKSAAMLILYNVRSFLNFLSEKEILRLYYKPINLRDRRKKINDKERNPLIKEFEGYLKNRNYSRLRQITFQAESFIKFTRCNNGNFGDDFSINGVRNYEDFLRKRIAREEISPATAYNYILYVKYFLDFLNEKDQISFQYTVPQDLKKQAGRSNEYVNPRDLIKLLQTVKDNSKDFLSDISILLILIETGCRPIEIANLTINDIVPIERIITLKCKKSHQRSLKLSNETIDFIKEYLKIRQNYKASLENDSLFFSTRGGKPIDTAVIYNIFRLYNKKAFGEIRFSPKSLRHTFITNALNNNTKIEKVASIVGHLKLATTLRYFYRDIRTIKQIAEENNLNISGDSNGN